MARFVAIDVETANSRRASICQIGLVVYENRKVVDEWASLVNPEDDFHFMNTAIHGIGRKAVASAPTLPKVFAEVRKRLTGTCVATYGDFDRSAFSQAAVRYNLPALDAQWLDLQHVVKKAWPADVAAGGWALKRVCAQLGIDLSNHHDALADARAAGGVFIKAQLTTNTWARDWLGVVSDARATADEAPRQKPALPKANPAGPLAGTKIVFTGELSMSRGVAESKAAALGCHCASSVSGKTTIVVVGAQDLSIVGPDGMSTKQRKALDLNAAGARIRVLDAAGFEALLRQHGQI